MCEGLNYRTKCDPRMTAAKGGGVARQARWNGAWLRARAGLCGLKAQCLIAAAHCLRGTMGV